MSEVFCSTQGESWVLQKSYLKNIFAGTWVRSTNFMLPDEEPVLPLCSGKACIPRRQRSYLPPELRSLEWLPPLTLEFRNKLRYFFWVFKGRQEGGETMMWTHLYLQLSSQKMMSLSFFRWQWEVMMNVRPLIIEGPAEHITFLENERSMFNSFQNLQGLIVTPRRTNKPFTSCWPWKPDPCL